MMGRLMTGDASCSSMVNDDVRFLFGVTFSCVSFESMTILLNESLLIGARAWTLIVFFVEGSTVLTGHDFTLADRVVLRLAVAVADFAW